MALTWLVSIPYLGIAFHEGHASSPRDRVSTPHALSKEEPQCLSLPPVPPGPGRSPRS